MTYEIVRTNGSAWPPRSLGNVVMIDDEPINDHLAQMHLEPILTVRIGSVCRTGRDPIRLRSTW